MFLKQLFLIIVLSINALHYSALIPLTFLTMESPAFTVTLRPFSFLFFVMILCFCWSFAMSWCPISTCHDDMHAVTLLDNFWLSLHVFLLSVRNWFMRNPNWLLNIRNQTSEHHSFKKLEKNFVFNLYFYYKHKRFLYANNNKYC